MFSDTPLSPADKASAKQEIDAWFASIPVEAASLLKQLEEKTGQMETFDLLSNISLYNHVHDTTQYSDYREDRMFVISELIALIVLKRDYITNSKVDIHSSQLLLKEIQEIGNRYFGLMSINQMNGKRPLNDYSIEGIAFKTMRDETIIRNPGLPEHHLLFAKDLYAPLETEIKKQFGFSVKESIVLRESIGKLINERFNIAKEAANERGLQLAMEVLKYRATGNVPQDSSLLKENLEELNTLSRKQTKEVCYRHCIDELFFHLGKVFCFTALELAAASVQDIGTTEAFLELFSCNFPSVNGTDQLVGPSTILKRKPLIEHDGLFLTPSLPLIAWCVEPIVENFIKTSPKLQNKFISVKHDFLLQKGKEFLSKIFGDEIHIYTNLYYHENNEREKRCETDGIFKYERTLFIIEAKAHRISQPAKDGKVLRTKEHMEDIVKKSYEQGLRTLNYVNSSNTATFVTDSNKTVVFCKKDFDEVILISLVLEPIGSITTLIRATNDLGYFKGDVFPWIISLYDLLIIADHFEWAILLPHYIKRRKEFLQKKIMHVFEEIDLMAYYLSNRLYIEELLRDAEDKAVNYVYLDSETDAVNNYYMHKYRSKEAEPPKLKLEMPDVFLSILSYVTKLNFLQRQELAQYILDIPPGNMKEFDSYIRKIKNLFAKDGKKHDCSILTHIWGKKVGFTFMTDSNKNELDKTLFFFSRYKLVSVGADMWIGLGDMSSSKTEFDIRSAFIARTK